MPEGHSIHRWASQHRQRFAGERVHVSSPQGRFTDGAHRLDGRRLLDVEAHGKHLFYRWEGGDTLHIHLGLIGAFRLHGVDAPPPTAMTRLAMESGTAALYLSGPMVCSLIEPEEEAAIHEKLGPDPLREPRARKLFAENLGRRRIPIAAAMLDQSVLAGIGNVFRSELLFLAGIDPHLPARDLPPENVDELWGHTVTELRRGRKSGRIITVDPADVGARRRGDLDRDTGRYVYQRDGLPCRRCGASIRLTELGNRKAWYCPKHQR